MPPSPSGGPPSIWNLHRVDLERLPFIDARHHSDLIDTHVSLALSDRERNIRSKSMSRDSWFPMDTIIQVKDTIHMLFTRMCDTSGSRLFCLDSNSFGGVLLFYFNGFRLDLASHTILADVCVVPWTQRIIEFFKRYGVALGEEGVMQTLIVADGEVSAWKQLLPVLVERCRTWSHTPSCRYRHAGRIPLSSEAEDRESGPICACGEGKDLGHMGRQQQWKNLSPYFTRAALSPLFANSYVERVGGSMTALTKHPGAQEKNSNLPFKCAWCEKPGKDLQLLKCGGCGQAAYCGQACQKSDWKLHKTVCKGRR
jgi:hypothetical protein